MFDRWKIYRKYKIDMRKKEEKAHEHYNHILMKYLYQVFYMNWKCNKDKLYYYYNLEILQ